MSYSNLMNPAELLHKENVVIIRMTDEFPNYETYSDIDVIGHDLKTFKKNMWFKFLKYYKSRKFDLKESVTPFHCHFDFFPPGFRQLDLMIDFMPTLECYDDLGIKPTFYDDIISRARTIERSGFEVKVPDFVDDLVLRYLEYRVKPEKTKHRDYVNTNKSQDFFRILEHNTRIFYED